MQDELPTDETLRAKLQLTWQDHFQTRTQTWKTVEVAALLIIGLVGADLKFDNIGITIILGIILLFTNISGICISKHHRKVQIRNFTYINRIEEMLGLHQRGLVDDAKLPSPFTLYDVINPRTRINTPLFILRTHITMLLFTMVYVGSRILIYLYQL